MCCVRTKNALKDRRFFPHTLYQRTGVMELREYSDPKKRSGSPNDPSRIRERLNDCGAFQVAGYGTSSCSRRRSSRRLGLTGSPVATHVRFLPDLLARYMAPSAASISP